MTVNIEFEKTPFDTFFLTGRTVQQFNQLNFEEHEFVGYIQKDDLLEFMNDLQDQVAYTFDFFDGNTYSYTLLDVEFSKEFYAGAIKISGYMLVGGVNV